MSRPCGSTVGSGSLLEDEYDTRGRRTLVPVFSTSSGSTSSAFRSSAAGTTSLAGCSVGSIAGVDSVAYVRARRAGRLLRGKEHRAGREERCTIIREALRMDDMGVVRVAGRRSGLTKMSVSLRKGFPRLERELVDRFL